MTTITMQTTLELITCVRCGVAFAAPTDMLDRRRHDHDMFYCPNGHNLSFPQASEAEKAQAQAAMAEGLGMANAGKPQPGPAGGSKNLPNRPGADQESVDPPKGPEGLPPPGKPQ